ncbi:DUF2793 domain-containing protein [Sulfitobacter aestuariivivens]|uniref:DUF2793 domain-containing protein n=1 Tax=Sulfitobacter aestuariivivens TaxID=2766981 RepID=A0A927D4Q6_9RHOB|nr:DUF2793 domain-containing protein [Sulfitobacter aestuariivivens]MBD3665145.1 DUF2793 domain-containing protein [Sulfitobacter aestuariivivens]
MPEKTPTLSLPYIQPGQAQKHVTHNEALRILDAVTQLSVISASLTEPPALPDLGDRYIIANGATGAWAGHDHKLALWVDNTWQLFEASVGWRADIAGSGETYRFDGTEWVALDQADLQNLPFVGVQTAADTTNRLAVSSDATLLNHAGGGHQLKLNKAGAGDTASLLFQTGFSGRAELGTTGSDGFAIKVSSDGGSFVNAMLVDGSNGHVAIGQATPDQALTVAANAVEPSVQVRNLGGTGGAAFRMTDDLSGGDWKFKIKADGSFKLRNETAATDVLQIANAPYVASFLGPVGLPSFTVATLPAAGTAGAGAQLYVSDEAGGAVPAFSDGTSWRRVTDRAIVS